MSADSREELERYREELERYLNNNCKNIPKGYKVVVISDEEGNFIPQLVKEEDFE